MTKGFKSPKTKTRGLRARAWWVLRKNKSVTLKELLLTLNDDGQKAAANNLTKYFKSLMKAGIIRDVAQPERKALQYLLIKDLGAKAPVVRVASGTVFDPNSGEVMLFSRQAEVVNDSAINRL